MHIRTSRSIVLLSLAAAWIAMPVSLVAQSVPSAGEVITVTSSLPTDLSAMAVGPVIEGVITARRGGELAVTSAEGATTTILVGEATEIRARGGFLGLSRNQLDAEALLNGLPVTVETVQWDGSLLASRIRLREADLATAQMIRNATAQRFAETAERFAENEQAIDENAAATAALRGRVANIDQYTIRGTTNVYFDTASSTLAPAAERDLCAAARQAGALDNALLLVVGYADAVGDEEYNQALSERRAGRVVNFLQQACGWAPWRMLTPTGMAEADPAADNATEAGRALNRRVSVNILVSKALEDL